jgi:hypothetical protein
MSKTVYDRRAALGALGLGAAGLAACAQEGASPAATIEPLDLADKVQANIAKVKMVGDTAGGPVHSFMRINIYGDANTGTYTPMFTMNNLIVDYWTPEGDSFNMKKYEAGVFTRFDSGEVIETWDNPWTGETIEIFPFHLGPVQRVYGPDGVVAMALAPEALPLEEIGDRLFYATQSIATAPSLFDPKEFPKESPGTEVFLNSFTTFSALARDVYDPAVTSAPVHMQLQNKFNWPPWLRMGQRPGGTVARGYGTKIAGLDALPAAVRDGFARITPEILDTANWTDVRLETMDYYKVLKAKQGG